MKTDNVANINTAIYLGRILKTGASVGVLYAGSIPYYTGFYAIDFLGKSDPFIAQLPPDTSGAVAWRGLKSVPGHSKYNLRYSILARKPTYVADTKWGRDDVTEEVRKRYVAIPVGFRTWSEYNDREILLLRDSPCVDWSAIGEISEADRSSS